MFTTRMCQGRELDSLHMPERTILKISRFPLVDDNSNWRIGLRKINSIMNTFQIIVNHCYSSMIAWIHEKKKGLQIGQG